MKFTDWLKQKNEYAGPNITPVQQQKVWSDIWRRTPQGLEQTVVGNSLFALDQNLFKKVTGMQRPPQFQGTQNNTIV